MAALLLPTTGCFESVATIVRAEASDYLRCPEDRLETTLVHDDDWDRPAIEQVLHHRGWQPWTAKTYRVAGCGQSITVECPDWNSFDQKPVCYPRG